MNDDLIAVDGGIRRVECAVFTRDFKVCESLAVPRFEPVSSHVELDADFVGFDLVIAVKRSGIDEVVVTVVFGKSPESEAFADVLFICGMDICGVADVGDHRHAGMGDVESFELGLPDAGEFFVAVASVFVWGELDIVEGHVRVVPNSAPAVDEGFHFFVVEHVFAVVGFALIPDRAANGVRNEWVDHAMIESEG